MSPLNNSGTVGILQRFLTVAMLLFVHQTVTRATTPVLVQNEPDVAFQGAMLSATEATEARLRELALHGIDAVALPLHNDAASRRAERDACERIRKAGLRLYFWIEVARCPELADAHPDWMASLQGHNEWRRLFKDPPQTGDGQVVKTYPWVPILNKEPFDGQLSRMSTLLQDRPQPDGVFLNDIQGAPSACGCGSHLCRWTSDYGNLRTTTPLGNNAPADFVAAVQELLPDSEIIPVWTTECEEHGGAKDGLCAGAGCFRGICWKAWTAQLMPVAEQCATVGVLLPYRAFQRNLRVYGPTAGWITHSVKAFASVPLRNQGKPINAERLLAVLQGWDMTPQEVEQQTEVATVAGVNRYLVAYSRIDQSWQPKMLKLNDSEIR